MKEYYNIYDNGVPAFYLSTFEIIILIIGLIILVGLIIFKNFRIKKIALYVLPFSVLIILSLFFETRNRRKYIRIMDNQQYHEVEGIVENFNPMPYSGHQRESFTVNGVRFEYSDFQITEGFRNTKSHGGPIDSGKYVRIRYYDGLILQLWVKE